MTLEIPVYEWVDSLHVQGQYETFNGFPAKFGLQVSLVSTDCRSVSAVNAVRLRGPWQTRRLSRVRRPLDSWRRRPGASCETDVLPRIPSSTLA